MTLLGFLRDKSQKELSLGGERTCERNLGASKGVKV